jgi:hypothetical protein
MPQFPYSNRLSLPCLFERVVPGRLHPDGRRYLPLIVLRVPPTGDGISLGLTDRHHLIDERLVGQQGLARVVLLLSRLRVLAAAAQVGFVPEPGLALGRASTAPAVTGRVLDVLTWEVGGAELPYETLYTELLLDVGAGIVGVRTNLTAPRIADALGATRLAPGDWLHVTRSRLDVLGFTSSR